jgi:hypothetical protein
VEGKSQLLEIVCALHPAGCFASRLNCRQQQTNQDSNDGNHHQQLDERKAASYFPYLHRNTCGKEREIENDKITSECIRAKSFPQTFHRFITINFHLFFARPVLEPVRDVHGPDRLAVLFAKQRLLRRIASSDSS